MKLKRIKTRIVPEEKVESLLKQGVLISKKPIVHLGKPRYEVKYTYYIDMDYRDIVCELIKEKYDYSDEFDLINEGIIDPNNAEYKEYRAYVNECKKIARDFVNERTQVLGK